MIHFSRDEITLAVNAKEHCSTYKFAPVIRIDTETHMFEPMCEYGLSLLVLGGSRLLFGSQRVSKFTGDNRFARLAGAILGTCKMGGQATRDEDRRPSSAVPHQYGFRPQWCKWPV